MYYYYLHTCLAALAGCFRKFELIAPSTGRLLACTLLSMVLGSSLFTLRWAAGILFSWSSNIRVEAIMSNVFQNQGQSLSTCEIFRPNEARTHYWHHMRICPTGLLNGTRILKLLWEDQLSWRQTPRREFEGTNQRSARLWRHCARIPDGLHG